MGEVTSIAWTDHTFNPWVGCTKVSPGCTHCYAEARDQRFHDGKHWGKGAPRSRTSPSNWRQPLAWNREAAAAGVRKRVFCASLADVFDAEVPEAWRMDLWRLIDNCPNLDWQLLTKRPENVKCMLPWSGTNPTPWPHVWLGTTVEDQERADLRIPILLNAPAAKRFLSVEPQLGPVDLRPALQQSGVPGHCYDIDGGLWHEPGTCEGATVNCDGKCCAPTVDWVIVGGESGAGARPFEIAWARSIMAQCKAARVPVFMKQLGAQPVRETEDDALWNIGISRKGGDPSEWPEDLRIREFPR